MSITRKTGEKQYQNVYVFLASTAWVLITLTPQFDICFWRGFRVLMAIMHWKHQATRNLHLPFPRFSIDLQSPFSIRTVLLRLGQEKLRYNTSHEHEIIQITRSCRLKIVVVRRQPVMANHHQLLQSNFTSCQPFHIPFLKLESPY